MTDFRGPFATVICLAATIGVSVSLLPHLIGVKGNQRNGAALSHPGGELRDPVSEKTLQGYIQATWLIQEGKEKEAEPRLAQLRRERLILGQANSTSKDDDISGPSAIMRLTTVLARAAIAHAEHQEEEGARRCIRQIRAITEQVLASEVPTMETLLTARALDRRVGRLEIDVFRRLGKPAEAKQCEVREARFDTFYRTQLMVQIAERSRVQDEQSKAPIPPLLTPEGKQAATDELTATQTIRDNALASVLLPRYRQERQRLGNVRENVG